MEKGEKQRQEDAPSLRSAKARREGLGGKPLLVEDDPNQRNNQSRTVVLTHKHPNL